jgi:integral membrane protein
MNIVTVLRICTYVEGVSYLLLLLVGLPLKYVFDLPLATRVGGGLHGFAFLGFLVVLYQAHLERNWTKRWSVSLLLLSLVPGSLFVLDRRIRSDARTA